MRRDEPHDPRIRGGLCDGLGGGPSAERPVIGQRTVAGLPLHDIRSLSEHDRTWLHRRLVRLRVATAALVLALALVVAVALWLPLPPVLALAVHGRLGVIALALGSAGLLTAMHAGGWWRRLAVGGVGALTIALGLALPPWLVAELLVATTVLGLSHLGLGLARRASVLARAGRLRADLAAGQLERFEAPPPRGPLEGLLARLHGAGYIEPKSDVLRLEVLPRSGVIVRAGGQRLERWELAHVAHVAHAQPHALRVPLPRGVAPTTPDPRLCMRRRSLTPQERAELEHHIDRLRRRWWPAASLTVVVAALVAYDLRDSSSSETLPLDGTSIGWLALLVLAYVGYARRVVAARKLEHDRRLRWVVTVHQDADPSRDPPSLEVLPVSQLAWTEQATPAGWRSSLL
ncbi:GlyGly-CTERM sorting domain-containing protein [Paraliomyxa miuraensis]|uniref:GlyGly-CTERM sorting domain-containing protein n=1 Tax=Paraliomyxa miuraensis TaxID=376150 RepID=UPI0022599CD7|nr:GlyGly-CTERM sorting domain-containing protein [Paraliomyxa miuraensis]MCX4246162.1 GlyGly-CTERM sorting domain-containing protein [Paraliomyxa miuraensis]